MTRSTSPTRFPRGGVQLTITTYTSGGEHSTGMIGTEGKFERCFGLLGSATQMRRRARGMVGLLDSNTHVHVKLVHTDVERSFIDFARD